MNFTPDAFALSSSAADQASAGATVTNTIPRTASPCNTSVLVFISSLSAEEISRQASDRFVFVVESQPDVGQARRITELTEEL